MSFIQDLAKQAAKMMGSAISHVRPGAHAKRLLATSASNRQSAWHYGTKVGPKKTPPGDDDAAGRTRPGPTGNAD